MDAFLAVATQWDAMSLASGKVHWHGLDYSRVQAGLTMAGIALSPADWSRVQIMEREATAALNGF